MGENAQALDRGSRVLNGCGRLENILEAWLNPAISEIDVSHRPDL